MEEKVVLILVDGMRPDGMLKCGNGYVNEFLQQSSYCLNANSVFPSVTLPCHMSLFHSVTPDRHGVKINFYTPPVRPIEGLFERLTSRGKKCGMFYSWGELRDLCRPGNVHISAFFKAHSCDNVDDRCTQAAIKAIKEEKLDFAFLYLGNTDSIGHKYGWMSEEYLNTVAHAFECIQQVCEAAEDYHVIITADHGGHERTHGETIAEDMIIPIAFRGEKFVKGLQLEECDLIDIPVTVADILGVDTPSDWEGVSRVSK